MDNPQHYQPLSHALHPPQAQVQPVYSSTGVFNAKALRAEEEEEEEEDGDDEGLVEEQLALNRPEGPDASGSNPASPLVTSTGTAGAHTNQTQPQPTLQVQPDDPSAPERKRRPGRPRGSKNRKPRVGQASTSATATKQESAPGFYHATAAAPQHPDVNAHNQAYYEFQWRVLNLCAEFYGAAEELVKGTQPLVIAQCYSMGPGNKVDPLVMLGEAKRICDTLLANPSQLISTPPPPIFSIAPTLYQPRHTQPIAPIASTSSLPTAAASSSKTTATPATVTNTAPPVISNPASFVMPLPTAHAHQTAYQHHPQYSMYAPAPGQYPTTPYYQYSYVAPASYYSAPQAAAAPVPAAATAPAVPTQPQPEASTSASAGAATTSISATSNQGAWSDEETERLKKLADDSRAASAGGTGEMEWDWVVSQWGPGRSRHQILIKATALGLKESSSRGVKRRRGEEGSVSVGGEGTSSVVSQTPAITTTTTNITASPSSQPHSHTTQSNSNHSNPPSASPSHSHSHPHTASTTPAASPALTHTQRPSTSHSTSSTTTKPTLPWPMPTVAVNTPASVVVTASATTSSAGAATAQDPQRTSYYRARPTQDASQKPPSNHSFIYQPIGPRKENGK
ncbi:hypothetical protein DXG03_003768 [Asterophora parasitica]|uniref:Myb-like domain-containing protein n=1 Tax=Asterophora parasitica TaxID=117018 RepID=A0A9P7G2Z5_9AGAR|nr:hypothetical protein DXG03_003768 [Asterophora parasitica]